MTRSGSPSRIRRSDSEKCPCVGAVWSDSSSVKVLLQDMESLNFVCRKRDWTANADDALDFGEVVRAVDYAVSHRLGEVRAVIKFLDSRYDLRLPPVRSVS